MSKGTKLIPVHINPQTDIGIAAKYGIGSLNFAYSIKAEGVTTESYKIDDVNTVKVTKVDGKTIVNVVNSHICPVTDLTLVFDGVGYVFDWAMWGAG